MKTKFKMPEVGDHILLKLNIHVLEHECLLTKLEDEEYCVINLENGKGIRDEHDDLDITRLSRELIRPKSANYGYRRESNHPDKVGVSLQLMSGHFLKTAEFTVEDIAEALDRGKCWLKQKNGGAINLRFVASYSPYKFYPKEDYRPGKQKR